MKRSDEITEALKTFFEEHECKMDADTKLIYVGAFAVGVEWADRHPKNAWHDAGEEPQDKNERILFYSEYFDCFFLDFPNYLMIKDGGQNKDWETVVLRNKMSKWAYVADLLPKGGDV